MLTSEYSEYYQEKLFLSLMLSNSQFTIEIYPSNKTYSVIESENIVVENFMEDYTN